MRRFSPFRSRLVTYLATLRRPYSTCALLGLGVALCLAGLSPALSGCGSSAPAASPSDLPGNAPSARGVARALRAEVERWEGTPYRMGGTTRRGVDCSGLMQRVYRDALGVDLSRSTRTQVREGRRVRRGDLRPGDLVFFRPGGKGRHVGVYVGEGEFAHASTSAGPTISPLAREYWENTYWTARRVLRLGPAAAGSGATGGGGATTPARTQTERGAERTGW
jgi:hypothetical protein